MPEDAVLPDQQMPAQAERRTHPRLVRPEYEDSGLFKRHPCIINVALVPQLSRSRRPDLIVRGLLECGTAVNVVFAGRRVKAAELIEAQLRKMLSIARDRASHNHTFHPDKRERASKPGARERATDRAEVDVDTIRLFVRVHGAWRSKFVRDDTGWETRNWQFFAAQWTMLDGFGVARQFGEPPYLSEDVLSSLSNSL